MLEIFMKFFVAFVVSLSGTQAFAVPTVRHLGGAGASVSTIKPTAPTPLKQQAAEQKEKSQSVKTLSGKPVSEETGARIPVINTIKTMNSGVIVPVNPGSGGSAVVAGVSEERFMEAVNRIEAAEQRAEVAEQKADAAEQKADAAEQKAETAQNQVGGALNNVVESGNGHYVTGVTADGNDVKVEKTRLLYAPVRNNGSDTIVSDAEIWLVK